MYLIECRLSACAELVQLKEMCRSFSGVIHRVQHNSEEGVLASIKLNVGGGGMGGWWKCLWGGEVYRVSGELRGSFAEIGKLLFKVIELQLQLSSE